MSRRDGHKTARTRSGGSSPTLGPGTNGTKPKLSLVVRERDADLPRRLDRIAAWLCSTRSPGLVPRRAYALRAAILEGIKTLEATMKNGGTLADARGRQQ